ncbi:OmpA family protein [Flavobacterium aciduliphilum]|uniref:Outer membrane protein OmpA-like peptidoglycan-associated protein n=1 Tax=Flavobacterium aciduliphilum TaxID=1101402 RepID=A0A328YFS3_9FLAO|nr:OmpA family protein [Flavobacterium aciduliphilum]RAR72861.1 outer membrane protein OmpA-like peptidoglycan-associated protein [Flavobacterium aciduliphilum]
MIRPFLFFFFFSCSVALAQNIKDTMVVYFDTNGFELKAKEKEKISSFFSREKIYIKSLEIEGFCDDIGTISSNALLSTKRAQAVSDYLKLQLNLDSNVVHGKGEIQVVQTEKNLEESRKKNRKAIITIHYTNEKYAALHIPIAEKENIYAGYKTFEEPLKVGDKIILNKILFKGSLTFFLDETEANKELDKIANYLKDHPSVCIEIQGHVCCISGSFSDAYDRISQKNNLSETRAERIFDMLVEKGVSSSRMTHHGYGRQFPLSNTEEEKNKRVEIVITKCN